MKLKNISVIFRYVNSSYYAQSVVARFRRDGILKKHLRLIIIIILAAVLLFSVVMLLKDLLEYRKAASVYSEARDIAGIPQLLEYAASADTEVPAATSAEPDGAKAESAPAAEPAEAEPEEAEDPLLSALSEADLTALQSINSDVIGWILIPGTKISYPIVHSGNNDYYLNRNWKKDWSSVGSIFLDCKNSSDLSDFNSLIFGHRMKDGSMFASLPKYFSQNYWQEHPSVYVLLPGRVLRYDIYAAYEAPEAGPAYDIDFYSTDAKESYIRYGIRCSAVNTGVVPTAEDNIITLVTCTGRGYTSRIVVQAVLVEQLQ